MTEPVIFECEGARLVGSLHRPGTEASIGVLVIVGGPQYRVGSHRQFVQLARVLAEAGYPVFRFDYRGMGDSQGEYRGFEHVGADIAAALAAFAAAMPGLERVVLWGLCDAATAAAFYAADAARPPVPVAGLVLANPWVRTDAGLARSYVRHYYGRRLLQRQFWASLLSGRMNVVAAVRGLLVDLGKALGGKSSASAESTAQAPLPVRLRRALEGYRGPVRLVLSGLDLTAKEFVACLESDEWSALRASARLSRLDLPDADHTFSRRVHADAVSADTVNWLSSL